MASVQDEIAADSAQAYDRPINVSVIEKTKKFPFLQELGFDGQLAKAKDTFHGLPDFKRQMTMYSSTNYLLTAAWTTIKQMVPVNPEVAKNLFTSKSLGPVGSAFKKMVGFDQVFAVSSDELKTGDKSAITKKLPV